MKNFMNYLEDQLNTSVTENGAIGYATTGHKLLDLNFATSSLRYCYDEEIQKKFIEALKEDPELTLKWLFFARDIKEGMGERRLFRVCLPVVADAFQDHAKELVYLVSGYGRFDDLFCLQNNEIWLNIQRELLMILKKDLEKMQAKQPVSLLAKWMPSENASSAKTRALAKDFIKYFFSPREYRKILSALRNYIDVTESKMSNNKWNEINYNKVPSKAATNYRNAFIRHDEERYNKYIFDVQTGKSKINASTLMPYEIWHKIKEYDETLEALWNNLDTSFKLEKNILVVVDGSFSMNDYIDPKSKVQAIDVSRSLGVFCAEKLPEHFKNKFITFSAVPELVDLNNCSNLFEKKYEMSHHYDMTNTDIKAVFDLILNTALTHNLSQKDLPDMILIISDMEFDNALMNKPDKKLFCFIKDKFYQHGYEMPRLVFWNVNSHTNTIPVKENELGVTLVSGFSPNILKMVMSNKLDPWENLLEVLNSDRYVAVETLLI